MKAMVLPRGRKWWSSISLERSFPDDSAWIRWLWLLDLGFCFFAYTNKNSGNDHKKWEKMRVWVRGQTCGRSDEEGCWAESNFANLNCGLNFFGIICQHLDCKYEWQARVKTDAHCPVSMCPPQGVCVCVPTLVFMRLLTDCFKMARMINASKTLF